MSPTFKALGLHPLSVAERLLLVEEVWDSIAEEAEGMPLTDPQREDLQRRMAAYEANPKAGSTWEEVNGRLQGGSMSDVGEATLSRSCRAIADSLT